MRARQMAVPSQHWCTVMIGPKGTHGTGTMKPAKGGAWLCAALMLPAHDAAMALVAVLQQPAEQQYVVGVCLWCVCV
jgi:hypothetical protein